MAILSWAFAIADSSAWSLFVIPAVIFGHLGINRTRRPIIPINGFGVGLAGLIFGYSNIALFITFYSSAKIAQHRKGLDSSSGSVSSTTDTASLDGLEIENYSAQAQGTRFRPDRYVVAGEVVNYTSAPFRDVVVHIDVTFGPGKEIYVGTVYPSQRKSFNGTVEEYEGQPGLATLQAKR